MAKLADAKDLKVRSGQSLFRANLKPCGRGEMAYAPDLSANLSARREIGDAELLKFGEPCNMAIPSQAPNGEGVETRRAAPEMAKG